MTIEEFVEELARYRHTTVWSLVGGYGEDDHFGLSITLYARDGFEKDVIGFVAQEKLGKKFVDDPEDPVSPAALALGLSRSDALAIQEAADGYRGCNKRLRRKLLRATNFHRVRGLFSAIA